MLIAKQVPQPTIPTSLDANAYGELIQKLFKRNKEITEELGKDQQTSSQPKLNPIQQKFIELMQGGGN